MITTPGYEPILEKIFRHFDPQILLKCLSSVCKYWNQVVQNPYFLLMQLKLAKIPEDILKKWKELAHSLQEDVNLTHSLSRCFFWALAACKNIGYVSPDCLTTKYELYFTLPQKSERCFMSSCFDVDFKQTILKIAL